MPGRRRSYRCPAVRLAHFPIGAHDSMPAACHLSAPKLVPELHRDFFERRSGCHGVFRQIVASVQSVARSAPPLLKAAVSICAPGLGRPHRAGSRFESTCLVGMIGVRCGC
jgi:hypothetical protein